MHAVDGVSFDVLRGETLGIVGETGCGKTTTARLMMRLLEPTAGTIRFEGEDVTHLRRRALKPLRREVQMIFQDPYSSLNPRKTVGAIIGEPFAIHGLEEGKGQRRRAVQELMEQVGLNAGALQPLPARVLGRPAPADRRRARARAEAEADHRRRAGLGAGRLDPGADPQPPAQAPEGARPDRGDDRARPLGGAAHVRPRGRDVPRQDRRVRRQPVAVRAPAPSLHGCAPVGGARARAASSRKPAATEVPAGDVPSPTNPPQACRFHPRCPKAQEVCARVEPPLEAKGAGTVAACHFPLTQAEAAERVPTACARSRPP